MNMHVGKFKVGDRVVITDTKGLRYNVVKVGDKATITRMPRSSSDFYTLDVSTDAEGVIEQIVEGFQFIPAAPLFAVGDKVRVVKNLRAVSFIGSVGSVTKTTDGSVVIHIDGTGERFFDYAEIEPAYTSCAAAEVDNLADEYGGGRKFKIGDRVNWTRVRGKFDGSTIDAIDSSGTWPVTIRATSGEHTYTSLSELEHVAPATAPTLTIRAGAYYKTRDGRKVGPMYEFYTSAKCFGSEKDGKGGLWHSDGAPWFASAKDSPALIAEWSDDIPLRGVSPVVAPATTAKFKVGDRVKFRDDYDADCRGKEATVVEVNKWGVQVDQGIGIKGLSTEQPKDLVLLPATTIADIVRKHSGTAVVMLLENGQPKPSTLPFVHLNKDAAAQEASRLAGIHKGQEFGVYECVDVRKEEKTYDHEWQRLAAGGQKINATRELRGMTGLGLATTKDAVEDWLKREAA